MEEGVCREVVADWDQAEGEWGKSSGQKLLAGPADPAAIGGG